MDPIVGLSHSILMFSCTVITSEKLGYCVDWQAFIVLGVSQRWHFSHLSLRPKLRSAVFKALAKLDSDGVSFCCRLLGKCPHGVDTNFAPTFEYPRLDQGSQPHDFSPYFVSVGVCQQSSQGAPNAEWSNVNSPFVLEQHDQLRFHSQLTEKWGEVSFPKCLARCAADVIQSSLDVARITLFKCPGVSCCSSSDVSLRTFFAAFTTFSLVTETEQKFSRTSSSSSFSSALLVLAGGPCTG